MTPEQLDQIQARADAATGGNWEVRQPTGGDAWVGTDYWPRVVGVVANKMDRSDAEFIAHARTDVPALLALVREQAGQIERVEALASSWESRGEYDMAYAKTMADEEASIQILASGAQLVDDARLIRAALNNGGTAVPEQPETLLEDTDPDTVFSISLSVADAVDVIEDGLRNDSMEDLSTLAFNIWGLLIDAHRAAPAATERA